MNSSKKIRQAGIIEAAAASFIALVLLSISLFWIRSICEGQRRLVTSYNMQISPIGLLPPEIEDDPNVAIHSSLKITRDYRPSSSSPFDVLFGINNYFNDASPEGGSQNSMLTEAII